MSLILRINFDFFFGTIVQAFSLDLERRLDNCELFPLSCTEADQHVKRGFKGCCILTYFVHLHFPKDPCMYGIFTYMNGGF